MIREAKRARRKFCELKGRDVEAHLVDELPLYPRSSKPCPIPPGDSFGSIFGGLVSYEGESSFRIDFDICDGSGGSRS